MRGFSCQNAEDRFDQYLQGRLDEQAKIRFETHVGACEKCRETLEAWKGFLHVGRTGEPDPISPMIRRRLTIAAVAERRPAHGAMAINWKPLAIASAGFAAAALVALLLVIQSSDFLKPGAELPDPDSRLDPGFSSGPAETAARISVTPDGREVIRVTPGTNLWLDGEAETEVLAMNDNMAKFRLRSGRVVAEVRAPLKGYRFIVVTKTGEVEAKGTVFSVEVTPDGKENAQVLRGVVEVRTNDTFQDRPIPPFTLREGERAELGLPNRTQAAEESLKRDACLVQGCDDREKIDRLRLHHDSEAPAVAMVGSRTDADVKSPSHQGEASGSETARATARLSPRRLEGSHGVTGNGHQKREQSVDRVEKLVSMALGQRKAGDYSQAADTYKKIISDYTTSTAARNALVSLGQLELVELGRPEDALLHYGAYIERAPKGFLVEEARLGQVRAYNRLGRYKKVVRAATLYLKNHSDGYAGAEVLRFRGDAKRSLRDCQGAIEDYQEILTRWPGSRQNSHAAEGISACLPHKSI